MRINKKGKFKAKMTIINLFFDAYFCKAELNDGCLQNKKRSTEVMPTWRLMGSFRWLS
jgi:hypothetical protein